MNKQKLGADNWLHIVSHALTKYAEEGGQVSIGEEDGEVRVVFTAVSLTDERLHPKLKALANAKTGSEEVG